MIKIQLRSNLDQFYGLWDTMDQRRKVFLILLNKILLNLSFKCPIIVIHYQFEEHVDTFSICFVTLKQGEII
jgi:hypothetical protein